MLFIRRNALFQFESQWVFFCPFLLQEAMAKDTEERTSEPNLNLKAFLADAYLHPIFHSFEEEETVEVRVDKHQTHVLSPPSEPSSPSPAHYVYDPPPPPQYASHPPPPPLYVYHPSSPPHYVYDQSSPPHYVHDEQPSPPRYFYHHEEPWTNSC